MKKINNLIISKNSSIHEAMEKIEMNQKGMVVVVNDDNTIHSTCTDGDIRRYFLENKSKNKNIAECSNTRFVYATNNEKLEKIIKLLDSKIKFLPIVDNENKIHDIYFKDHMPKISDNEYIFRSKSPVRISFGGGGSDTTNYFSNENRGIVVNSTICLFSHASLEVLNSEEIIINSIDLNRYETFRNTKDLYENAGELKLISSTIKTIDPDFGFRLTLNSDYPPNSGLGGSAAVVASILGCFNELNNNQWNEYELSELAFQSERLHSSINGGWQDQYATIFGGMNFMEFSMEENLIHTLRLRKDVVNELESNLFLCNTKVMHNSGDIHSDQKIQTEKKVIKEIVKQNISLTIKIRDSLLKGDIDQFGELLHQAWINKKQFSEKISNKDLDSIYEFALKSGASGGKLLGAGGGGFFLFYVPLKNRVKFIDSFKSNKYEVSNLKFDTQGLVTWKIKK